MGKFTLKFNVPIFQGSKVRTEVKAKQIQHICAYISDKKDPDNCTC